MCYATYIFAYHHFSEGTMRTNRLFWGVLLALAGLVLLAQNFGLIDPGFWKYIGAILLILIGVWIIVRPRLAKEELAAETITLPLEGLTEVKVEIEHGAGRLEIGRASCRERV